MADILLGSHTIKSHGAKVARFHMYDWIILVLLAVIDGLLNIIEPFHRFVGKDMMTDLRYPMKGNTVPFWAVPVHFCSGFMYWIFKKSILFLAYFHAYFCIFQLHIYIITWYLCKIIYFAIYLSIHSLNFLFCQ